VADHGRKKAGGKENLHAGHRKRKREQFLLHGMDAFSTHEALELLLFYALPRVDTNALAHVLLKRFGSLEAVLTAPVEELTRVEGVGEGAAILLRLVPEIYKRSQLEKRRLGQHIPDSDAAAEYLITYFWNMQEEMVVLLNLDERQRVQGCHVIGSGNGSASSFQMRELVQRVLSDKASFVYLAHNHPSGVALPSRADDVTTQLVRSALHTIGVTLLDHIIFAGSDFTSMGALALPQDRMDHLR
jgi:DNA repair protein RadC